MGAQVEPYWCNGHSLRIPRTPSTLDHMLFFGKLKSTPNLRRQNPGTWTDLKECLKIEHLMKTCTRNTHICFEHTSIFDAPLLSHITKYQLNSNLANKLVCSPLEPAHNNPLSLMLTPPPLKALSLTNALHFPTYVSPKFYC
jgi:hypothetical protein